MSAADTPWKSRSLRTLAAHAVRLRSALQASGIAQAGLDGLEVFLMPMLSPMEYE